MIRAATLLVALALAGCQTMPPLERKGCDVEVAFGSYAMGVDRELKTRIVAFVDRDDDVAASSEREWGREGESTLCVQAVSRAGADRLYRRIAAMLPARSERAPTTVTHRDGRTTTSATQPGG